MSQFLVVYNRESGESWHSEFSGDDAIQRALDARFDAEAGHPELEAVILSADSLEDLLTTHSRYFKTTREIGQKLEDLLAS